MISTEQYLNTPNTIWPFVDTKRTIRQRISEALSADRVQIKNRLDRYSITSKSVL